MIVVILIGGALLLGLGPFGGDGRGSQRVPTHAERQAERQEAHLAKSPEDEQALLAVTRAWIEAGDTKLNETDTTTQPVPSAVAKDFRAGIRAWNRYLRQTGGKAGADIAELAGATFFSLVEIGSSDPGEAEANAAGAVRALRIAGRQRPTLYTLSNLAAYEYFDGENAAGDRAARRAAAGTTKAEARGVIEQLDEYRERGEAFVRQVKAGKEKLRESGEEELSAPIKGYGSRAGINGGKWPAEFL